MKKSLALSLLVALALPGVSLAQSSQLSPEIKKLKDEIAAVKLDRTLNLTRDQSKALLPLLKEATALRAQLKAEQEKRRPEIVKALTGIRDDLVKAGVVSPDSRKALELARGEGMMNDLRAKVRSIHEKMRAVLNPEQRARLHEFDPRPLEGGNEFEAGFGGGQDDKPGRGGPHGRPGGGKLQKMFRVATSPEFIALVETRAK